MDPANAREALREVALDVDEGADMVMVKPALPYLDVLRRVRDADRPARRRLQRLRRVRDDQGGRRRTAGSTSDAAALEALAAIRRAGADIIITYYAKEAPMARMASLKVRTRKDGAAVAMDDADRSLLNLLQGTFPLDPRPYAKVAAGLDLVEDEVVARLAPAGQRADRPPGHARSTTRARSASPRCSSRPRSTPRTRGAPAKIVNAHPGVSHNYLRNHEFNLWFTIATEPDSELGLEGTLQVLAAEAGAESVRQLPTLKLFKIRMDLEMVGDTEALASAGRRGPAGRDRAPALRRDRHRGHPRHAGRHADRPRALRPGGRRARLGRAELLEHLEGMQERRLLRRVAAILFHRRAGFSANGMGVWKVPDDQILEIGGRMASFRGISHCYQRPTYADWPYSVFTMAHGRSKEECDAILDAIAQDTGIHERSTLYSSTEFKKIRLQYFTDEFKAWERAHS